MKLKTKEEILKFFRNEGVVIVFRNIEPNGFYNKKYNIITDGIIKDINEKCIQVSNSTVSCNVMKELKIVFVETMNNNNILNIFDLLCKEMSLII